MKASYIAAIIIMILVGIVALDYNSKHSPSPISCILSIDVVQGNGSVSGTNSGIYLQNTTITLQAHPDSGFVLQKWQVHNNNMGNESSFIFTLSQNTLVQVFFGSSSISIIQTDPVTTGFAGVKVAEHFTSLNNSIDVPQMNLFLFTGNQYFWIQTMLAEGNILGLSSNGLPNSGFWVGCQIWDAGSHRIVNSNLWQSCNGYFYDHVSSSSQLMLFTFIGTDQHLHTTFSVNGVLVANIDWSVQQSILPTPLPFGSEFVSSGLGDGGTGTAYLGNEVIFTGYLTSQGMDITPSVMDASGTMIIQTFVDGAYCSPKLGYVYRTGNGQYWIPPPTNITWYSDDSAEWVQSVVFQINGNVVSFSSLPTLSSWCTGIALVTDGGV